MNDDEPKTPATGRRTKAAKPAREGRRSGLDAGLALILAILAVIASGYLWFLLLVEHPEMLRTDVAGNVARLSEQSRELRESMDSVESDAIDLRDTQDALKAAVEKISNDLARSRTEWMLTEAEQLIIIANNRLHLARDIGSALAALRAADRQLNLVGNPNLLPVRRELAQEIAQLEAIEKGDVAGLALKLSSLAESVDRLPLALEVKNRPAPETEAAKPAEETRNWRSSARSLWTDLKSLVRIRRNVEAEKPLLAPEQQYFLRENLRLMLYGAQQGLLQGHVTIYRQNLRTAARWIRDYFDINTQVVASAQTDLDKLLGAKVAGELPDLSASLEALRRTGVRRAGP
jgi:uroporphyrin-III C-methyltransferase